MPQKRLIIDYTGCTPNWDKIRRVVESWGAKVVSEENWPPEVATPPAAPDTSEIPNAAPPEVATPPDAKTEGSSEQSEDKKEKV